VNNTLSFRTFRIELQRVCYQVARALEENWPVVANEILSKASSLEHSSSLEEEMWKITDTVERVDKVDRYLSLTSFGIDWPKLRLEWSRMLIANDKTDIAEEHLTVLIGRLSLRSGDREILEQAERELERLKKEGKNR